jgi:hypothetical protein
MFKTPKLFHWIRIGQKEGAILVRQPAVLEPPLLGRGL